MAAILAVFLAKLISLSIIALAIIGALISRKWWHILFVAIAATLINEVILNQLYYNMSINPQLILFAMASSALWAALVFWIRTREYNL